MVAHTKIFRVGRGHRWLTSHYPRLKEPGFRLFSFNVARGSRRSIYITRVAEEPPATQINFRYVSMCCGLMVAIAETSLHGQYGW